VVAVGVTLSRLLGVSQMVFCAMVSVIINADTFSMLRSKSFLWWEKRMVEDALATKGVK